jgi:hypothetical protein
MLSIAFVLVVSVVDFCCDMNIVYKPSYCMLIGSISFALATGRRAFSVRCRENLIDVDCFKINFLEDELTPVTAATLSNSLNTVQGQHQERNSFA